MGLNSEYATRHYVVLDIETAALENAADYLDAPEPDKRLTDPAKIAADVERKRAEQADKCALDWNVGRVVALGAWWPDAPAPTTYVSSTDGSGPLLAFADCYAFHDRPRIVGYNCRKFDLPFLQQQARYLRLPWPGINLDRYRSDDVIDLFDLLTFGDSYGQTAVMRRTLDSFCRRFNLDVPDDPHTGRDVAALVAAGDWDAIAAHCRADVIKTRALAVRLGVIPA